MRIPFLLLKYIGKALLNVVGGGFAGDLLVEAIPEVAKEAWGAWSKDRDEKQRRAEVEAIAQAAVEEVREQVAEIKQAIAPGSPPEIDLILESYLTQVPAMVRKSMRRPSDPTGTTVSTDLVPKQADDLLPFLPPNLPRFKRGDHPLVGVDWELEELLGVGGFGEVWKARNPHLTSAPPVALKFCLDAVAAKVLRNEAAMLDRVMRQGKHPGIVQLLHTYLSSETPCLEYEWVEGGDLAGVIHEWHRSGEKPKPAQAAKVVLQLAEIVGFAHRLNPPIVHRDLKPANILVNRQASGELAFKVADFGIGGVAASQAIHHNRCGTSRGEFLATAVRGSYTPLYASPQQMRGEPPDPREDVFALGVIWYQLLTGDLWSGRPGGTRWHKRLTEQGVSSEMVELLGACFEDSLDDRPLNAQVLHVQLGQQLTKDAVQTAPSLQAAQQASLPKPVPDVTPADSDAPARVQSLPGKLRLLLNNRLKSDSNTLSLANQDLGDEELIALASSPLLNRLKELNLAGNRCGDEGIKALANSPFLSNLCLLNLSMNPFGDEAVKALANCPHLSQLTVLDLSQRQGTELRSWLAQNRHRYDGSNQQDVQQAKNPWTNYVGLTDESAKALVSSPYLTKLVKLNMSRHKKIGDTGWTMLVDRFGEAVIYE